MTTPRKEADRGAVMQFEFDLQRMLKASRKSAYGRTAFIDAHDVVRTALQDVFDHGGTLVVVVGQKKMTVVQRPMGADQI